MYELTNEQILLLDLSEEDIISGKLIAQDVLDKNDLKWLKDITAQNNL